MNNNQTICKRCICDISIPGIIFDDEGVCNFCRAHDQLEKEYPLNEAGKQKLNRLVEKIKAKGKNKKYDCVIGVSGGADSTYCLYTAKKLGLRPLAVHLDNHWDTDVAVNNIEKAVEALNIDLKTIKCDRNEFKDIQISFLKASVSDAEIPTDVAIISTLYKVAAEEGLHYVINGHSFRMEGLSPTGWTYMDGRYIQSVHKRFGNKKLESFQNLTISNLLYYIFIERIKVIPLLSYINYNKQDSKSLLEKELGWVDYGAHHFESIYTRFVITNLLPKKFKIDKRIVEYSAYIRSDQMSREQALEAIKEPLPQDNDIAKYCRNKLGLTSEEFERILTLKPRTFLDYPTNFQIIMWFKLPIKIACMLHILPRIFYEKYFNWDYRSLKRHYLNPSGR